MTILLWLFNTQLGRTVAISGLIVIGIGVGWLMFATHYENKGYAKAMHAIAAQDAKAAQEAKVANDDVQRCFASGGSWDIDGGLCQPASSKP